MAVNQKLVKEKLDEWATVQTKLNKAATAKNKKLDPFIKEHNERIEPILSEYNERVAPLNAKAVQLKAEISQMLKANTDKDGNPKTISIGSDAATVTISKSEGSRVVSVQKFFDAVKEKNQMFWSSLTVVIKHAEKLLGKEKIDEISEKKTTFPVVISLNK